MKYVKPVVIRIELSEEDIIVTSGCTTASFQSGDSCISEQHQHKYYDCTNKPHTGNFG